MFALNHDNVKAMSEAGKAFYMVWNFQAGSPTVGYTGHKEALDRASLMSKMYSNRGMMFFLIKSTDMVIHPEPRRIHKTFGE